MSQWTDYIVVDTPTDIWNVIFSFCDVEQLGRLEQTCTTLRLAITGVDAVAWKQLFLQSNPSFINQDDSGIQDWKTLVRQYQCYSKKWETGQYSRQQLNFIHQGKAVNAVVIEGEILFTACDSNIVESHRVRTHEHVETYIGGNARMMSLTASANYVASGQYSGPTNACVWKRGSGESPLYKIELDPGSSCRMVHIIESRDLLFIGVESGKMACYRLSTGDMIEVASIHKGCISCCVNDGGDRMWTGDWKGDLIEHKIDNWTVPVRRWSHPNGFYSMAFVRGENRLISGHNCGEIAVRDLSSPESMEWYADICKDATEGVTVVMNGRYVVGCGFGQDVTCMEVNTGKVMWSVSGGASYCWGITHFGNLLYVGTENTVLCFDFTEDGVKLGLDK